MMDSVAQTCMYLEFREKRAIWLGFSLKALKERHGTWKSKRAPGQVAWQGQESELWAWAWEGCVRPVYPSSHSEAWGEPQAEPCAERGQMGWLQGLLERFGFHVKDSCEEGWHDKPDMNQSFKRMICQQSTEKNYSGERLEAEICTARLIGCEMNRKAGGFLRFGDSINAGKE